MDKLQEARQTINEVDKEMAELFEKRMKAVETIAEYKKELGLPIFDANREEKVIKTNSELIQDDKIKEYYINFLKKNIEVSRDYQYFLNQGMKVAYSGVPGAFGFIAAKQAFPSAELISYPSFASAYEAVEKGNCDVAILPIENSYAGDVGAVMDLIFSGSLYINQVIDFEVNQNLVANKGTKLEDIKKVISHPQALSQCSEYLEKHKFIIEEAENTALAAKKVSEGNDSTLAAIASIETANIYSLEVVEKDINTVRNNTTRFGVFSRVLNNAKSNNKVGEHFILTFTVLNEAGSLAKTLNIIGSHGYNMRNLRSRPMKELMWNYYFYVELDGLINTINGKEMLNELSTICDKLKLVGIYYNHQDK